MDKPKFYANERVDSEDVAFLTDTVLGDFRRHMRGLVVGDSALRVLDGFTKSILVDDTTLRITLGKAIAAEGVNAVVTSGQILSEGVASQDLAFAALGAATYGVWIKFQYADGINANRKFYDVNTDTEKPRNVKTRSVAGWAAKISVTSPGAEWMQIYSVIWNAVGLGTSTINDTRAFLFEGKANASPAFESDWGAGNDRNNDRALFGVKTLERFAAAVLKKIEEMQSSSARWWTTTVEPLDKKVSRFGDLTLLGAYAINGSLLVDGTVEITSDLTVDDILSVVGLLTLSNGCAFYKSRNSASAALPILGTDSGIQLDEINTSNNAIGPPLYFTHHGADGGTDGVAFFSKRIAEDNVHLKLGYLQDGNVVSTPFEWDPIAGIFTAANTDKASGVVTMDGAGGITSQLTQNCVVSLSGTDLLVTFTAALPNASYGVLVEVNSNVGVSPVVARAESKAAGQFVIKAVQWNSGTQQFVALNFGTSPWQIDFRVWHV